MKVTIGTSTHLVAFWHAGGRPGWLNKKLSYSWGTVRHSMSAKILSTAVCE